MKEMCLLFPPLGHPTFMNLSVSAYRRISISARVYTEFCVRHFLVEISGVLVHRRKMYLSQRNH